MMVIGVMASDTEDALYLIRMAVDTKVSFQITLSTDVAGLSRMTVLRWRVTGVARVMLQT